MQHHVSRFDVSVNHEILVGMIQGGCDLTQDADRICGLRIAHRS
jgi:hypothetical protein